MKYSKFGKTGVEISNLGFGCMRLELKEINKKKFVDEDIAIPLLKKAYESGINYFDTAVFYCEGDSQRVLGKALSDVRDKVYLSTKIPLGNDSKYDYYRRSLENSLKALNTDYIDFYHFHGINKTIFDDVIVPQNMLKAALLAKEEGLIRNISFSFHDEPENMKYIIDNGEIFDSVLCQYNLLDRSNESAIEYAASKGLGVVAMGPVAGGRLSGNESMLCDDNGKSISTYELAFKFVLSNKNISCALSGMSNMDMLEKNLKITDTTITKDDRINIEKSVDKLRKFNELYCTGCGYCMPCPCNVNIPKVFEFYTLFNVYGSKEQARGAYNWHLEEAQIKEYGNMANACIKCKKCEQKCPQKIKISEKLELCHNALN